MRKHKNKTFHLGKMNAAMGEAWADEFCNKCKHDHSYWNPCEILSQALGGDVPPKEHIINEAGQHVCTAFESDPKLETHHADKNDMPKGVTDEKK